MTGHETHVDTALIGELLGEIVAEAQSGRSAKRVRIGLMSVGSEHTAGDDAGQAELLAGARASMKADAAIEVVMIGPKKCDAPDTAWIVTADDEAAIAAAVKNALDSGEIAGAVALHYPFPLGVATIGRIVTPFKGREMLIASTTGTSATDRVESMTRNAVYGIATAKALGIANPTVGILNVDGAASVGRLLGKMQTAGYAFSFGASMRKDRGALLRGNDLLAGTVDVCVTDTLTGNVLMKLFSAWNNGGIYETTGFGYGPSVGEGWQPVVSIVSRASGAPVIANAILYTAEVLRGKLAQIVQAELQRAYAAGLKELLAQSAQPKQASAPETVAAPPAEPTDEEVHGIDVLSIEEATHLLWKNGIYAEASMGCTGPVVKIAAHALTRVRQLLAENGYL